MIKVRLSLNGKDYILQHPGARAWVKLQQEMVDLKTDRINVERLMDFCFEHVVFPVSGPKLSLDTLNDNLKELEDWQTILPSFLRGLRAVGYSWSDNMGEGTAPGA